MILQNLKDLTEFRRDPLTFFSTKGNSSTEPLVRLNFAGSPTYLVSDPDVARWIFKAAPTILDKGSLIAKLEIVMGRSILTLKGEAHRKRREILHKRLARGALSEFVPQLVAVIRQQLVELSMVGSFEATEIAKRLSMRMASVVLFGNRVLSSRR